MEWKAKDEGERDRTKRGGDHEHDKESNEDLAEDV
jgi:hypothetical protein